MILRTMYAKYHSQGGGNVNANLPMMLAMMSLVETVRIYQMLQKNEVHRHPLFAGAYVFSNSRLEQIFFSISNLFLNIF